MTEPMEKLGHMTITAQTQSGTNEAHRLFHVFGVCFWERKPTHNHRSKRKKQKKKHNNLQFPSWAVVVGWCKWCAFRQGLCVCKSSIHCIRLPTLPACSTPPALALPTAAHKDQAASSSPCLLLSQSSIPPTTDTWSHRLHNPEPSKLQYTLLSTPLRCIYRQYPTHTRRKSHGRPCYSGLNPLGFNRIHKLTS